MFVNVFLPRYTKTLDIISTMCYVSLSLIQPLLMKVQSAYMDSQSTNPTNNSLTQSQRDFLVILEQKLGIITHAADAAKIHRTTVYDWLKQPAFAAAVKQLDEAKKDFGESLFLQQMKEGNTACILHFVKTKCKERGYGESREHGFDKRASELLAQLFAPDAETDCGEDTEGTQ